MNAQPKTEPTLPEIRAGLLARKDELNKQTAADNATRGAMALKAAQGDTAAAMELAAINQRLAKAEQERRAIDAAVGEIAIREKTNALRVNVAEAEWAQGEFPSAMEVLHKACDTFDAQVNKLAMAWDAVTAAQVQVGDVVSRVHNAVPLQPGDVSARAGMSLRADPVLVVLADWLRNPDRPKFDKVGDYLADRESDLRHHVDTSMQAARAELAKVEHDLRNPSKAPSQTIGDLQGELSDRMLRAHRTLVA
jgi:hypothetical protein